MGIDLVATLAASRCGRCRNDDIDLEADQLGDASGELVDLAVCVSSLNNNVLALHPAALPQSLPKRGKQGSS